jgi:hypothetical protein
MSLHVRVTHEDGSSETKELSIPVDSGAYALEKLSVAPQFSQQMPALQRRTRCSRCSLRWRNQQAGASQQASDATLAMSTEQTRN